MSVPKRARARAGPGAPPRYPPVNRLLALAASAAATATAQTSTATAQTYFVAPDGADTSGSCTANTASNAFPTIQDALACAVSGDTISLAPTGSTPYPGFGTVSQNITISAASGATARTVAVDETTAALTVGAGATVKLTGVTLNGGSNPAAPDVTNHGVLTLTRDSITGSPATGGIENSSAGASAARLTLNGTTVSGNVGGGNPDCSGHLADGPGGHNLIGNIGTGTGTGACSGLTNGVNGDQVSVPAGLLPLASNGGPTNTAALAAGSPAIGAAGATTCEQAPINDTDQRGHSRNATTRGGCDIGAYDTGGAS